MTLSLLTLRILLRKLYLKARICETKGTFSASSIHPPFSLGCVPPLSTLAYLTLSDSKEEFCFFYLFWCVCVCGCVLDKDFFQRGGEKKSGHMYLSEQKLLCAIFCLQKCACVFRHKGICVFSRPIYCQMKQLH